MSNDKKIAELEAALNSLDLSVRANALCQLNDLQLAPGTPTPAHNLHCHTFYSYNGYNYSPEYIAWLSRQSGWFAAGTVDFDVLDAVGEFMKACILLDVRGVCGIETRAFVKELADKEINSPGEPGVAYHMGVGFTSGKVPASQAKFATEMKATAAGRTRHIVELVNRYLSPVELDFEKDAAALTPQGNVTERHACLAFRLKAEQVFPDPVARAAFWAEKFGCSVADAEKLLANPVKLEAQIRAKTMKKGGAGYVKADPSSFPTLQAMNEFTLACGALPTVAWLNGESSGEADPGALLDLHLRYGAVMLNIIPDRNWNFADLELKKQRVEELNRVIAAAEERFMPIIVGTEMNAPGLKLVDDFDCDALAPHVEKFVDGAAIAFAHTMLQVLDKGYNSVWSEKHFPHCRDRNRFFAEFGRQALWSKFDALKGVEAPEQLLKQLA